MCITNNFYDYFVGFHGKIHTPPRQKSVFCLKNMVTIKQQDLVCMALALQAPAALNIHVMYIYMANFSLSGSDSQVSSSVIWPFKAAQ